MADPQVQANDEQEIAEAQNSLVDLLYDVVAQGATTRLGAFVYRRIDSVLSTVEKTAKWSLPQPQVPDGGDEANADGSKISAPPLIRPLPWMLFLPALVVMRMVRVGLSLLALLVGRPPVTPASVVHFVQNKRRKLRALKYRGQKLGRISRAEAKAEDELQTTWLNRIIMPLRTIVCRPGRVVVTPHRHHHRHPQRQQNQQQQQQQHDQQPGRKRNAYERDVEDDDDSGHEVDEGTVSELLDKYADDAGDSSFHADSASGESSDSSLSEQEKSTTEDVPSKPPTSEPVRKESNGHAHKEGSQARRKSDLNVESASKPAENGSVDGSKKQDAAKEPAAKESDKAEEKEGKPKATENGPSDGSKNQDAAKEERQKQESNKPKQNSTLSDSERTDSKQTSVAGQKNQQEEDAAKAQSMSDVKTNFQQKSKQQQQQQQNQPQNQPQHVNANGGSGGKKQKRPSQGHQA
uniref:Proteinral transcription factor iif subunit 1 n=2 Tax=Culex tarsalis TaxID=7177 RepID=A0A1Q3EVR7_CULTA